jgi:glycosyltransferase involved in cell wall biosynthesis
MNKVLVIPSWYPTKQQPLKGIFFQEQSLLLSDHFDIRVLYIEVEDILSQKKGLKRFTSRILRKLHLNFTFKVTQHCSYTDQLIKPSLLHEVISINSNNLDYIEKILEQRYERNITSLINSGWTPDLIHAHSVRYGGLIAYFLAKKFNIPYVLTEHMPFNILEFSRKQRILVKESFENASQVLAISNDKIKQIGISGIEFNPMLVYNYVDESKFILKERTFKIGDQIKIITISAAHQLKDPFTLLEAIKIIKAKGLGFHLTIVGLKAWEDPSIYTRIINFIKSNDLESDVTIYDLVEHDSIPNLLSQHDVFILSSIAEGMPVSVLEAMACGLIVIATKHGGSEDIITHDTGILVNLKDFHAIAEMIEKIARGTIQFDHYLIREHVINLCGRKAFRDRITKIYMSAIGPNN